MNGGTLIPQSVRMTFQEWADIVQDPTRDNAYQRISRLEQLVMTGRAQRGAQAWNAIELARWLVTMDDPEDVLGREERREVTLTRIIERAKEALDPPRGGARESEELRVLRERDEEARQSALEASERE